MKKLKYTITGLIATAVLLGLTPTTATLADTPQTPNVKLNNNVMTFPDAKPFVDDHDRTMVPVRFIAEGMGADVTWFGRTNTVVIQMNGKDVRLHLGDDQATVNGVPSQLDTQTVMKDERVYVPLRFVSEQLGAQVSWDGATSTVLISYTDPTKQPGNNGQTGGTTTDPTPTPDPTKDQWGRTKRTTNLPKNAADYPYILADVPNEMYEMAYPYSSSRHEHRVSAQLYANQPEFTKQNVDIWMDRVRKAYDLLLNVDYNTIDDGWASRLFDQRSQGINREFTINDSLVYVNWVRQNKIKIEGTLEPEPSMIYDNGFGYYCVRSKFRFKVDNFEENKDVFYDIEYNFHKLEKGVWYEGYADIPMGTNVMGDWGSTLHVSVNATILSGGILRPVQ